MANVIVAAWVVSAVPIAVPAEVSGALFRIGRLAGGLRVAGGVAPRLGLVELVDEHRGTGVTAEIADVVVVLPGADRTSPLSSQP
ncbi:MAG TPA: hypothetical protein VGR26_16580 [Acidimicrobiales bacterium]|nr:hypothetical protein [Acidimicrobiales bacterium]